MRRKEESGCLPESIEWKRREERVWGRERSRPRRERDTPIRSAKEDENRVS